MKKYFFLLVILLLLSSGNLLAGRKHSSGSYKKSTYSRTKNSKKSEKKPVHVSSYKNKKGTTIKAYDRSTPGTANKKTSARKK
jgi:hypothetical protein